MSPHTFLPVVIIGAPRSGTNILRDVLASFPRTGTWPCDEINYIWRHGNLSHRNDELPPERATPEVIGYIRKRFLELARSHKLTHVVEKTCANSLRVPFVDRVLPDARYIYIVRDGRDVVASAQLRWKAPLDLPYLLRKARWVPPTDLPYYFSRYLMNRIHRLVSGHGRLAHWGPVSHSLETPDPSLSTEELCAIQWRDIMDASDRAFEVMDPSRFVKIRYEELTSEPEEVISDILHFLKIEHSATDVTAATRSVTSKSVGNWRRALTAEEVSLVERVCAAPLARHGYL